MDALAREIFSLLVSSLNSRWVMEDDELHVPVYGKPGMMKVHVRIDDAAVIVTEFDGWSISGEYRFTGAPDVMVPRAAALLTAIASERA